MPFFERYLTPISLAVLGIGMLLIGIGPLRTLLAGPASGIPRSGDGPITAQQVIAGVAGADTSTVFEGGPALARQVVPFTTVPDRPRDTVETYTVQAGDTLFGIANRFRLDPNTIFWANSENLRSVHNLQKDLNLFILPVNGVYHRSYAEATIAEIATKYSVTPAIIINSPFNQLEGTQAGDVPPWGMRIVVEDGVGQFVDFSPIVEEVDQVTGAVRRSFMPGMGGSCAAGIAGRGGSGAWGIPVSVGSYAFSQSYYPGHSGVDLAAVVGTPVLASDSGVVVFAGWVDASWGYGQLVVLDHGNGWTTYYAHLSSVGVGCGQFVGKGGYVGGVGSTGNSSGPHLHFEMRWNHVPDNPASYLGF
ncbi:MAG: M23 family metallopeptidase [Anaerolineae bacterium]|nr:M23 family metallopeptidase [Anaerolineae bacterium]